jgi:hypothetical protein
MIARLTSFRSMTRGQPQKKLLEMLEPQLDKALKEQRAQLGWLCCPGR